jgi:mRNA-degrading endonuclease toxin of MazEF toxin-antitoxin module
MIPGSIVIVHWRDALQKTGEPNKMRPSIAVGRDDLYGEEFGHLFVVPMTSLASLAVTGATVEIHPTHENGCLSVTYALTWNAQTVPIARVQPTNSRVTDEQLGELRNQVARLVER